MGAAGKALRGGGLTGTGADGSDNTDILEIVIGEAAARSSACASPARGLNGAAATYRDPRADPRDRLPARRRATAGTQGLVLLTDNRLFTIQPATLTPAGTALRGHAAAINGSMNLAAALPEWPTAGGAALPPAGGVQALLYTAPGWCAT